MRPRDEVKHEGDGAPDGGLDLEADDLREEAGRQADASEEAEVVAEERAGDVEEHVADGRARGLTLERHPQSRFERRKRKNSDCAGVPLSATLPPRKPRPTPPASP